MLFLKPPKQLGQQPTVCAKQHSRNTQRLPNAALALRWSMRISMPSKYQDFKNLYNPQLWYLLLLLLQFDKLKCFDQFLSTNGCH
jgi:hypothetical protein